MLKRLNRLEKQYGGAIPFSALEEKDSKNKTKRKSKSNKSNKPTKKKNPINKSQTIRKHRKRSISPSRIHRNNTRKLKRSKNPATINTINNKISKKLLLIDRVPPINAKGIDEAK